MSARSDSPQQTINRSPHLFLGKIMTTSQVALEWPTYPQMDENLKLRALSSGTCWPFSTPFSFAIGIFLSRQIMPKLCVWVDGGRLRWYFDKGWQKPSPLLYDALGITFCFHCLYTRLSYKECYKLFEELWSSLLGRSLDGVGLMPKAFIRSWNT